MTGLYVQIDETHELRRLKERLLKIVPDPTEYLDQAAAVVLNRTRARYLREVDPDGNPWVPSIAGQKRRASGGTGTLFDTGKLFHSIHAVKRSKNERVVTFDQSQAPYGRKHQLGEGVIQRKFLGVNDEDAEVVEAVLLRAMRRRFKKL